MDMLKFIKIKIINIKANMKENIDIPRQVFTVICTHVCIYINIDR